MLQRYSPIQLRTQKIYNKQDHRQYSTPRYKQAVHNDVHKQLSITSPDSGRSDFPDFTARARNGENEYTTNGSRSLKLCSKQKKCLNDREGLDSGPEKVQILFKKNYKKIIIENAQIVVLRSIRLPKTWNFITEKKKLIKIKSENQGSINLKSKLSVPPWSPVWQIESLRWRWQSYCLLQYNGTIRNNCGLRRYT